MSLIPVGEWLPDQADFNNPGSPYVMNVLPATEKDYGPLPSMAPYSNALTKTCQGAATYSDPSGNIYSFAADQNDLYLMTSGSAPTFNKVSKTVGGYNATPGSVVRFTNYGNYVLSTDYNDPMQVYTIGTSSAFTNLAVAGNGTATMTIGGSITAGDTVAMTIQNAVIMSTAQTVTYTVAGGDTPAAIATHIASLIDANTTLNGVGISATSSGAVVTVMQSGTISSQTFISGAVTGAKTETVIIAPANGALAGGTDQAPQCKFFASIRNFLMCANTYDTVNGAKPQRLQWSGIQNPMQWPTPGTQYAYNVQSDFSDVIGDYGAMTGLVADLGTADGAVFFQRAVFRINYQGPPTIFSVLPAENVRGTSAPGSIVQQGALVFYRADDGFYVFDGTYSVPIGFGKIDKTFLANADPNYINQIVGGADPLSKNIYWSYATTGSNGVRNAMVIYNTELKRWSQANFGAQMFVRDLAFGYTLDQLNQFGTLNNLPAPLDSPAWAGGRMILAAFDSNNKMNYFNGPNSAATVDTAETQVYPGCRAYVSNVRPLVDGGVPSVQLGTRNRQEDIVVFNAGNSMNALGTCPQRAEGRYMRGRIEVPAAANWNHIMGIEVTAKQMGAR